MIIFLKSILRAAVPIIFLFASSLAFSGDGSTTFESFYRQGLVINWWVAGIAAALIGILVFVGFPFVAPWMGTVIGTIGSSIGGLFGLSGIAATNAGLALLGGGAISTGGFGIIGGTALLAAALTFGTDVTLDYALGSLTSQYEASKFSQASLKMVTLPLPVNTAGPESMKAGGKALDSGVVKDALGCAKPFFSSVSWSQPSSNSESQFEQCMASKQKPQQQLVRNALLAMNSNKSSTAAQDLEREAAMYALLHFLNNDYGNARKSALTAYQLGTKQGTPTLPAFIYATSSLYDDSPNLANSLAIFKYSIDAEPKNPLTPVLFSAYLDRLSYRLNDGAAGVGQIDLISKFAGTLDDDIRKLVIQQTILSHDLMQVKVAQQRILSITGSQSRSVRENPNALNVTKKSLNDYNVLLAAGRSLTKRQSVLLDKLSRDNSWLSTVTFGKFSKTSAELFANAQWPEALQKFNVALDHYERNRKILEDRVTAFEKEQSDAQIRRATEPQVVKQPDAAPQSESRSLFDWIKGIFQ